MKELIILLVLGFSLNIFISCNEVDDFGSDLLEDDLLNARTTDYESFSLSTATVDNLLMYIEDSALWDYVVVRDQFLLGDLDDPTYGETKAEVFMEFVNTITTDFGDPDQWIVDSVALFIAYDSTFDVFGYEESTFDLKVHELIEPFSASRYYTSSELAYDMMPLGQLNNFSPKPKMVIQNISGTDTSTSFPRIRVPLDVEFGERFIGLDTLVQDSVEAFLDLFKGYHVEMTKTSGNGSITRFQVGNSNTSTIIYYHHRDSVDADPNRYFLSPYKSLLVPTGISIFGRRFGIFNALQRNNQNTNFQDGLIYSQNLGGQLIELDLEIDNSIFDTINLLNAVLELTVNRGAYDTTNFNETVTLVPVYRADDPDFFRPIEDYLLSVTTVQNRALTADDSDSTNLRYVYRFNITKHLSSLIEGSIEDNKVYLRDPLMRRTPYGTVLYDKGNETFPARMQLIYNRRN